MELNYIDPECLEDEEKILSVVSGYQAGLAYNDICKMLGGRFPDCRLQEQAPIAHEFFMKMMGSNVKVRGAPLEMKL